MNRRFHAIALIVLLLAGPLLGAAGGAATLRIRVAAGSATPRDAEALCRAVRDAGAAARLLADDAGRWIELTAAPGRMAQAMEALRTASAALGVEVELPDLSPAQELLAVPAKSGALPTAPRPTWTALAAPLGPETKTVRAGPNQDLLRGALPPGLMLPPAAWSVRGPPA